MISKSQAIPIAEDRPGRHGGSTGYRLVFIGGVDQARHLAQPRIENASLKRDVATFALTDTGRGAMRLQFTGTSPAQPPRYLVSQKRPA